MFDNNENKKVKSILKKITETAIVPLATLNEMAKETELNKTEKKQVKFDLNKNKTRIVTRYIESMEDESSDSESDESSDSETNEPYDFETKNQNDDFIDSIFDRLDSVTNISPSLDIKESKQEKESNSDELKSKSDNEANKFDIENYQYAKETDYIYESDEDEKKVKKNKKEKNKEKSKWSISGWFSFHKSKKQPKTSIWAQKDEYDLEILQILNDMEKDVALKKKTAGITLKSKTR